MQPNMPHWLTKQASIAPDNPAMELETGEVISFRVLQDESATFARKLQTLGVKEGNHVGILSSNRPSFIIAVHALSYIGAVAVLLNVRLTKDEIHYQLIDSETSYVLTSPDIEQFARGIDVSIPVRTFSEIDAFTPSPISIRTEISLDDPFTIIYTSGTTGFPKGVIHTYGNHWWSAVGSMLNLGTKDSDKWLATLPFFHVGGLSIFIRSVIYGIPVYVVEKFTEEAVHEAIMHKGITIASVVTVMLERLVRRLGDECYPSAFRCMLLGGSAASRTLLEEAKSKEIPVFQSYGMTETSSQIVTLAPRDALYKIGSSGKPLFPAQVTIRNQGADGIGEIHVKGPMITGGYYNKEKETENVFSDGWLATGDLGLIDEEGFLYIVDRRKDLIISGGENVYPSEVEAALLKIDGINEAGVVGVDDAKWGATPAACIVTDDDTLTRDYIVSRLKESLAGFKVPKQYYEIEALPRNASQKVKRNALLAFVEHDNMIQ